MSTERPRGIFPGAWTAVLLLVAVTADWMKAVGLKLKPGSAVLVAAGGLALKALSALRLVSKMKASGAWLAPASSWRAPRRPRHVPRGSVRWRSFRSSWI
jgi:hypothetical protein